MRQASTVTARHGLVMLSFGGAAERLQDPERGRQVGAEAHRRVVTTIWRLVV
jgi:hypothetical protein